MKIGKAIEILADYKMESAFEATTDFEDALKLGIEAMKRCQVARKAECIVEYGPLLGETT